jgi:hypothetical protein
MDPQCIVGNGGCGVMGRCSWLRPLAPWGCVRFGTGDCFSSFAVCVERCINYIDESNKGILMKAKDGKIIVSCQASRWRLKPKWLMAI